MNEKIAQEILHELFPAFEALETQSAALLQLLKDKGIANEEELAAHFEQAGKASSVRWLAVRVRIDYLLSSAMKTAEQDVKKESLKTTEKPIAVTSRERETHEDTLDIPKTAASRKPVADDTGAGAKNDPNQQGDEDSQARKCSLITRSVLIYCKNTTTIQTKAKEPVRVLDRTTNFSPHENISRRVLAQSFREIPPG
jgi:hypothetical protein